MSYINWSWGSWRCNLFVKNDNLGNSLSVPGGGGGSGAVGFTGQNGTSGTTYAAGARPNNYVFSAFFVPGLSLLDIVNAVKETNQIMALMVVEDLGEEEEELPFSQS